MCPFWMRFFFCCCCWKLREIKFKSAKPNIAFQPLYSHPTSNNHSPYPHLSRPSTRTHHNVRVVLLTTVVTTVRTCTNALFLASVFCVVRVKTRHVVAATWAKDKILHNTISINNSKIKGYPPPTLPFSGKKTLQKKILFAFTKINATHMIM